MSKKPTLRSIAPSALGKVAGGAETILSTQQFGTGVLVTHYNWVTEKYRVELLLPANQNGKK
jgi:hypothetical protein